MALYGPTASRFLRKFGTQAAPEQRPHLSERAEDAGWFCWQSASLRPADSRGGCLHTFQGATYTSTSLLNEKIFHSDSAADGLPVVAGAADSGADPGASRTGGHA